MFSIVLIFVLCVLAFFWYSNKRDALQYWQKLGFPTLPKSHFIFGDVGACFLGRGSLSEFYRDAHFEFKKKGHKVGGVYFLNNPLLILIDPDVIKRVLQTNFDVFSDRGCCDIDVENNPLSNHLFNLPVEPWTVLQRKMGPAFTSGKVKNMFPVIERHMDMLIQMTHNICDNGNADIIYLRWLLRSGIDIVGDVMLGFKCNILEGADDTLWKMTQRIFHPKLWDQMQMLYAGLKNPGNVINLMSTDKEVSDFFIKLFKDTVEHRKKNAIEANDFMQVLINLFDNEMKTPGKGLTFLELAAQAFLFLVAGYETTARTIDFALYALAHHPHVQSKLRHEIKTEIEIHNGDSNFDWIMQNEYLNMVLSESMRMYPSVVSLHRQATKDCHVEEINLTIPKGTNIIISNLGVHQDPDNYKDPAEFIPERFAKENAQNINRFANLPFGEGPRICLGKRFGYMHAKLAIAKVLNNFEVLPGTNQKYPFEISHGMTNILFAPKEPFTFKFKPL